MMRSSLRSALASSAAFASFASFASFAAFAAFAANTTPNSVVTPQTPNRGVVQFLQGTDAAATYKVLYAAGPAGSICKGMFETNNDASATHLLTLQIAAGASVTGSIGPTTSSVTGAISGSTLNVTAVGSGILIPGETLSSGTAAGSVLAGTQIISQINGVPGGVGNYLVTLSQTVAATTITGAYATLNVTAVASGMPTLGSTVSGTAGVSLGTSIIGYGTAVPGTTGIGTYYVSPSQTAGSQPITSGLAGVKFGGAAVTTASSDGFANGVPAKALTSPGNWPGLPLDSDGNPYIVLSPGDTIEATFGTSLTSTDFINVYVACSDF